MSARNGKAAERQLRRRRRKLAAATSTVLMVAAAVAGEPISLASNVTQVAGGVGDGLNGMTDPGSVSASGRLAEDDRIGADLLDGVDDLDNLLDLGQDVPSGKLGINGTMLGAYMQAAQALASTQPNCKLHWSLLASIGRIESNHARGGRLDAEGNTSPQILGPVLNGGGFAAIRDTDGGKWDGDSRWDRAVGAMQFIPSTWEGYAADGNADGVRSPHNVYDATVAAGKYLCSGGMDLSNPQDRATAVFRYNHSNSYVATVLSWADAYARGVDPMPSDPVLPDTDAFASGPPSIGNQGPKPTPSTNPPNQPPAPNPPPTSSQTRPPTSTTTTPLPPCVTASPTSTTTTPPTSTSTSTTTTTTTPSIPGCEVTRPSQPPLTTTQRPTSGTSSSSGTASSGTTSSGTSPDGGPSESSMSSSSAGSSSSSAGGSSSSTTGSVSSSSSAEPT
ncbi:lytic transglycosylase domain-containing protein [Actinophytocola glycyrrhizae]|uniref:Lytic transglycosylase domain-containing protein n=1 Tax=Actinophytocola glycyrrhizae TaxID=2044873 RepID=A0ABV9RXG0_9PSEU